MMSGFSFRPSRPSQQFLRPKKIKQTTNQTPNQTLDRSSDQKLITENNQLREQLDCLTQLISNQANEIIDARERERQLHLRLTHERENLAKARSLIEQSNNQLINQSIQLNESRDEINQLRHQIDQSINQSNNQSTIDKASIERLMAIKSQRDRQVASLILERNKLQFVLDQSNNQLNNQIKGIKHIDTEEHHSNNQSINQSAKKVSTPRTPNQRDSFDYEFDTTINQSINQSRRSSSGGTILRLKKTITLLEEKVTQLQSVNQSINQSNLDLTVRFKNATDARNRAEKKFSQLTSQSNSQSPKESNKQTIDQTINQSINQTIKQDENHDTNIVITRVSTKLLTPRVESRGQRWTR